MIMKLKLLLFAFIFHMVPEAQTVKHINGSATSGDSLKMRIQHLMQIANVSCIAISLFNNKKAVYSKTFGLAYAIGDIYTSWKWENYIPYNLKNYRR